MKWATIGTHAAFLLVTVELTVSTKYSQRFSGSSAIYDWQPSGPPPVRRQLLQSRTASDYYPDHGPPPPPEDVYRSGSPQRLQAPYNSGGGPESRTVTASVTWPPDQGHRDAYAGYPDDYDDYDHALPPPAVPSTNPATFATLGVPYDNQVVRTTFFTPLSHGYVVSLVRKQHHLKGKVGGGALLHRKPNHPVAFRGGNEPAFLVYLPTRQQPVGTPRPFLRTRAPRLRVNPVPVYSSAPVNQVVPLQAPVVRYVNVPVAGDLSRQLLSQQPPQVLTSAPVTPGLLVYVPQDKLPEAPPPLLVPLASPTSGADIVPYQGQNTVYSRTLLGGALDPHWLPWNRR